MDLLITSIITLHIISKLKFLTTSPNRLSVSLRSGFSPEYKAIDSAEVEDLMQKGSLTIADIRDLASFQISRLKDALHISNANVEEFVRDTDFDEPLLVYCYHGISSQSAAMFFGEQGFKNVYHLIGGFEAWRANGLPTHPE